MYLRFTRFSTVDEMGDPVYERSAFASMYFRSEFGVDLAALLPCELIPLVLGPRNDIVRLVFVVRLIFCFQYLSIFSFMPRCA